MKCPSLQRLPMEDRNIKHRDNVWPEARGAPGRSRQDRINVSGGTVQVGAENPVTNPQAVSTPAGTFPPFARANSVQRPSVASVRYGLRDAS